MATRRKASPRRSKYGAIRTQVDGITFDSKKEAGRYVYLKGLQTAGEITDLECHPPYDLMIEENKVCKYIADFRYRDKHGVTHVEDVKGVITSIFRLKAKLMKILLNIDVEIVK